MFRGYYLLLLSLFPLLTMCSDSRNTFVELATETLGDSTLLFSEIYLNALPITVTSSTCPRSAGGIHDFYSEGDYWWPDSTNLSGPYIRRDGETNPNNFTAHREALVRLSEIAGNLTSAYLLTADTKYANAVLEHCQAWFINPETMMAPHLLYAQAIQGRHTGRGIGIIDAIHFMEVVQSLVVLESHGMIDSDDAEEYRAWFADFLTWLTKHPYGKDEMVHPNNHGTCWNMQVGLYATYTQNDSILAFCRKNFEQTLVPTQMAIDGSFPLELERTKPYGYALFNLDAMTMNCLILSNETHNLWEFSTDDGRSIHRALDFMAPYVADKAAWPLPPDVMYWNEWPVAHPSFLFGALYFKSDEYFSLWETRKHVYETFEVKRNMPIRNPLIWMDRLQLPHQ